MSGVLTAHSPISTWITNSTYKLTMLQDGHRLTTDQATFQNTNVDLFFCEINGDEMGFVLVSKTIAYENIGDVSRNVPSGEERGETDVFAGYQTSKTTEKRSQFD